ncbi:MAG: indolepyruvate oxidoreductase subunit beta [Actinomycetes bacterium]|jgi:indolepyruvate ferredoxin oxidoreductase beta subunit|nr:indolepyruvate oxidoreductase subunit beta [Actinomycetes bacterium]
MTTGRSTTNVLIAGVGGQGTVLAARLVGSAALASGLQVRGSETIGMAQRGGSVVSHLRLGHDIASPLIAPGTADVLIAFEPGEAARAAAYLKPDGVLVACDRAIIPAVAADYAPRDTRAWLRDALPHVYLLDGEAILRTCGARALNVVLLGATVQLGCLPFGADALADAIRARLQPQFHDMNLRALNYGAELVAVAASVVPDPTPDAPADAPTDAPPGRQEPAHADD